MHKPASVRGLMRHSFDFTSLVCHLIRPTRIFQRSGNPRIGFIILLFSTRIAALSTMMEIPSVAGLMIANNPEPLNQRTSLGKQTDVRMSGKDCLNCIERPLPIYTIGEMYSRHRRRRRVFEEAFPNNRRGFTNESLFHGWQQSLSSLKSPESPLPHWGAEEIMEPKVEIQQEINYQPSLLTWKPGYINISLDNGADSQNATKILTRLALFGPSLSFIFWSLDGAASVVTISGNILVLTAFFLERTIRTATNYFIASLAVTDLLIGIFSMNFFTLYLLLGYWPLGSLFCKLWLSLDYTACLTSQYTVLFITADRFLSVKIPAKYRNWRTDRKVIVMIAITWAVPASIFYTIIMGWETFNPDF
ncbi:unnamed protein product, partial [Protopolystoma xenopodis]